MFLPLSTAPDLFFSSIGELEAMLETPADEYRISLLGPEGIMPDTALAIFHLITGRPHPGRVIIKSLGSLLNSDVLVWLAGDERSLRSDAWIRFEPPFRPKGRGGRLWPRRADPSYERVLEFIGHYLPREFVGRTLWAGELAEWALIEQKRQP